MSRVIDGYVLDHGTGWQSAYGHLSAAAVTCGQNVAQGSYIGAIGRILKIGQQTVANWISDYVDELPPAPVPEKPQDVELDELYTFLQHKNEIHIPTVVDRATHCVLSWDAVCERTSENMPACLELTLEAKQYYTDAFPVYDTLYLWYTTHLTDFLCPVS